MASVRPDLAPTLAQVNHAAERSADLTRQLLAFGRRQALRPKVLDVNQLVVKEAWVGKNIVMKRFAARGRGRGSAIFKPFSEITVIVRETEPVVKEKKAKVAKPAGAKPAKAASAKKEAV